MKTTSKRFESCVGPMVLAAIAGCVLAVGGCAGGGGGGGKPEANLVAREGSGRDGGAAKLLLDGDVRDWTDGAVAAGDEHYLYTRFTVENEVFTLQAAAETVSVLLDVDANGATGVARDGADFKGMGFDLEVQFSPATGEGVQKGTRLYALDKAGGKTPLSLSDWEIAFSPTYASTWYELRVGRTPSEPGPVPVAGLQSVGAVRGVVTLQRGGAVVGYADPFGVELPPAAKMKATADVTIPSKPVGALRVMTYNVLKASPNTTPEPFARTINAINPDVVIVQEWENTDDTTLQGWFAANVPTDKATPWRAKTIGAGTQAGGGVGVISRYPIGEGALEGIESQFIGKNGDMVSRKVRFIAVPIQTPMGVAMVGSTHLKCCGSYNTIEEVQRVAEAKAIEQAFAAAALKNNATIRVIAGDMNLVGGRAPLDTLANGADVDGSELAVAQTVKLGDNVILTWRDEQQSFAPGRLDYMLYSDASVRAVNAFVFDASRLSTEALERMKLDRGVTNGSDHLPVVVDLMPVK
jgi:endonuclease/exonuclease/phosphatase family metal-dependent hydrolase